MMYLMVAGGLVILLVGGDVLVRGAVALAQRLGVPPLVIGLTVVAFGTSSPELVVCVKSAIAGVPEIAIGNVVGSNIANILLVLGLPAVIFPIACNAESVRRDSAIMVGVSVLFVALCWTGLIQFWQGAIMLALLIGFLVRSYLSSRNGDQTVEAIVDEIEGIAVRPHSMFVSSVLVLVGLVGLVAGSSLLVDGATGLARAAGIPEEVIGLTLVAIGTSLPELATSVVAAIRRHGDVAVGNVVGSNLFNILGIMGVTAMVRPIPVPDQFLTFDLWLMLASSVVLLLFVLRGASINRMAGTVLAVGYAIYLWALFHGVSAMADHAGMTG